MRAVWWLALGVVACGGEHDRRSKREHRDEITSQTDLPSCDERCADRAASCSAPPDVTGPACSTFCAGSWTRDVMECLESTSCEDLGEAWLSGDRELCRTPGDDPAPETCEQVCDGANGLSMENGVEVSWVQALDCRLSGEDQLVWESGAAPGSACSDPDDPDAEGALACAHHTCGCCGEESYLAAACENDRCLSASEACALARTAAADPFYSHHLCD